MKNELSLSEKDHVRVKSAAKLLEMSEVELAAEVLIRMVHRVERFEALKRREDLRKLPLGCSLNAQE